MSYNARMKILGPFFGALIALTLAAYAAATQTRQPESAAGESLGTVSFSVSCAPAVRSQFVRGVALLHDFLVPRSAAPIRADRQERS